MKKLIKPSSLALYLLMFIAFFIIGLFYANLIGAGEGQMLAAAAIVLGWGVLFGGIAFIASIFAAYYIDPKIIKRLNWGLLVFIILTIGIFRLLNPRQDIENREEPPPATKPTAPVGDAIDVELTAMPLSETNAELPNKKFIEIAQAPDPQLNIGFFKPNFYENSTLYFYGGVNLQKGLIEHAPQDSVVFELDQNGNFTTSYGPPWLFPEHMKLDYGIIYFEVESVGFDFLKVITNKTDGRIAYIDKVAGDLLFWPEFLITVNTVEFPEGQEQPVRIKPLDYAGKVQADFVFMKPIMVGDEWMQVVLLDDDFKDLGKGWVRWQKDGNLLIHYSLLS